SAIALKREGSIMHQHQPNNNNFGGYNNNNNFNSYANGQFGNHNNHNNHGLTLSSPLRPQYNNGGYPMRPSSPHALLQKTLAFDAQKHAASKENKKKDFTGST